MTCDYGPCMKIATHGLMIVSLDDKFKPVHTNRCEEHLNDYPPDNTVKFVRLSKEEYDCYIVHNS